MATAEDFKKAIQLYANSDDAVFLQRFFRTGKGQYGEGDVFIGVRVPQTRAVCKQFKDLSLSEIQLLLDSPVHEHRLAAVLLLVGQFTRADEAKQRQIYDMYIKNVRANRVNNWDIVDSSAPYIVGAWVSDESLVTLAESESVWCRRVAVMTTFAYIKAGDPELSLQLSKRLLHDPHDLIQKAVGWMIREVGRRGNRAAQLAFLDAYAAEMPRTMLRYAIEHLEPVQKQRYMNAKWAKSHKAYPNSIPEPRISHLVTE